MEPAVLSTAIWALDKAMEAATKYFDEAEQQRADLVGRCEKLLRASQETVRGLHREVEEILLDVEKLRHDPEREEHKNQVVNRINSYLHKHDLLELLSERIIPALRECHIDFKRQHEKAWLPKTERNIALSDMELLIEKLQEFEAVLQEFWGAGMSGIASSQLRGIMILLTKPLGDGELMQVSHLVAEARQVSCEQFARPLGSEAAIIAIQRFR